MARYIDAEDFKAEVRKISKSPLNEWDTWGVLSALERVPTADVAPVVHAHWIETEDLSGDHYAECSNCCLLWWIDSESSQEAEMNYCPRCGAKMDEVTE